MKRDIGNREDLVVLVHSFYEKLRANDEIGYFFIQTITDWEAHLEKLTDFWESNLFTARKYSGNPIAAHVEVDEKFRYTVNPDVFGLWLNLWFETLEDLFEGENVELLKRRARKMGTFLMINIYENRTRNQSDFKAQTSM